VDFIHHSAAIDETRPSNKLIDGFCGLCRSQWRFSLALFQPCKSGGTAPRWVFEVRGSGDGSSSVESRGEVLI